MSDRDPEPVSRVRIASVSSQIDPHRTNTATWWAWTVALVPAAPFLVALALVTVSNSAIGLPILLLLIVVAVAASVGAAAADRGTLLSRGFENVADARLALVPVIYLWKRDGAFRDHYVVNYPFWVHVVVCPSAVVTFSVWANFVIGTS